MNGIRAVLKKGFWDWFEKESPDVLCLQETKATKKDLEDHVLEPKGYHTVWNSADRRGYSGVVTFHKKKPREIHLGMGLKKFDGEGRLIRSVYRDFDLLNVYFPSGTSGPERLKFKLQFYDAFLDYCDALRAEGKKLVIAGDVNTAHRPIDLKNPKANEKNSGFLPEERAWIDRFIEHGYVDAFRKLYPETVRYTWWTYRFKARDRNIGWRIDYFFLSEDLVKKVKDAFIQTEVTGSDHCPIGLELKAQ